MACRIGPYLLQARRLVPNQLNMPLSKAQEAICPLVSGYGSPLPKGVLSRPVSS